MLKMSQHVLNLLFWLYLSNLLTILDVLGLVLKEIIFTIQWPVRSWSVAVLISHDQSQSQSWLFGVSSHLTSCSHGRFGQICSQMFRDNYQGKHLCMDSWVQYINTHSSQKNSVWYLGCCSSAQTKHISMATIQASWYTPWQYFVSMDADKPIFIVFSPNHHYCHHHHHQCWTPPRLWSKLKAATLPRYRETVHNSSFLQQHFWGVCSFQSSKTTTNLNSHQESQRVACS